MCEKLETFEENKLINNLKILKHLSRTTKCPGLVHIDIWNKVGVERRVFPTGGEDTDFAMKLWKSNIRVFKGSKV